LVVALLVDVVTPTSQGPNVTVAFSLNPGANINHTHHIGVIVLAARRLVDRFGPPEECDGYKVSGQYRFEDDRGRVYTVYDWKETSLFDDGVDDGETSEAPTPDEFWSNENPITFHIGGRDDGDVEAFKNWLSAQVD
jgi:hypothetical protein